MDKLKTEKKESVAYKPTKANYIGGQIKYPRA